MAKQKDFKPLKSDAIVRYYKSRMFLWWTGNVIATIVGIVILVFTVMGKVSPFNFMFSVFGAAAANYLFFALRKMTLNSMNSILTKNCDPVKYEEVFRIIDPEMKHKDTTLNIARGLYYRGNWQESLKILKDMPKYKENTNGVFQYYNILACCYESSGDLEKVFEIREKAKQLLRNLKPKSQNIGAANQLISILDGMITMNGGSYSKAREILVELLDTASFALSRMNASLRLAKMEQKIGAGKSAIERCEYIIDDGGTTFYVEEAKALLLLCRGGKAAAEALPETIEESEKSAVAIPPLDGSEE